MIIYRKNLIKELLYNLFILNLDIRNRFKEIIEMNSFFDNCEHNEYSDNAVNTGICFLILSEDLSTSMRQVLGVIIRQDFFLFNKIKKLFPFP